MLSSPEKNWNAEKEHDVNFTYGSKSLSLKPPPEDDLFHFLSGRRVAIVGSANCLLGSNNGELIDSYDAVIRFNRALHYIPFSDELSKDVGQKTSVLVMNQHTYREDWPKFQEKVQGHIKHTLSLTGVVMKNALNILQMFDCDWCPSAGFATIVHMLSYPVKEIYITNFNFYHGGKHLFLNYTTTPRWKGHDFYTELRAMRFIRKQFNLHVDDVINKLLQIKHL
jgi:hypothetical protein